MTDAPQIEHAKNSDLPAITVLLQAVDLPIDGIEPFIDNFLDITCLASQVGLRVTNWTTRKQYIEIRKKDNQVAMFVFPKKGYKKEIDFGYWEDAEVVYSINEVEHK